MKLDTIWPNLRAWLIAIAIVLAMATLQTLDARFS